MKDGGWNRIIRLGLLALEVLPCWHKNASRSRRSYLSFFSQLVEIGNFKEVGLISLDQRFCSIDVKPSYFPNGLQTLMVSRGVDLIKVDLGFPQQQVIRDLGINYVRPMHYYSHGSYSQIKSHKTESTYRVIPKIGHLIGCLIILSRGTPIAPRMDKEMLFVEDSDQSLLILARHLECLLLHTDFGGSRCVVDHF